VKAHSEVQQTLGSIKTNYVQLQEELQQLVSADKLKLSDLAKVNNL